MERLGGSWMTFQSYMNVRFWENLWSSSISYSIGENVHRIEAKMICTATRPNQAIRNISALMGLARGSSGRMLAGAGCKDEPVVGADGSTR